MDCDRRQSIGVILLFQCIMFSGIEWGGKIVGYGGRK